MDDLSGLSWTSSSQDPKKPPPMGQSSAFAALRPTPPVSGRSTPLSVPTTGHSNPSSKPATPANDSFSNLVSFGSGNATKTLSLQEQQRKLQEEKSQQDAARRKQLNSQYSDGQFWDSFDTRKRAPVQASLQSAGVKNTRSGLVYQSGQVFPPASHSISAKDEDEDDILAAFKSTAPVDSSTNFPKPTNATPGPPENVRKHDKTLVSTAPQNLDLPDDDDPFGLSQMQAKTRAKAAQPHAAADDDDVLGLLSRPVSDFPKREPQTVLPSGEDLETTSAPLEDPRDRAIAELVDMGFPPEKAREALESTESGTDIQAAVGWLLNQAHSESRQKAQRDNSHEPAQSRSSRADGRRPKSRRQASSPPDSSGLAWMRDDRGQETNRPDSRSTTGGEKDPAQIAAELSANFFKTANSLWKTGTKRMQQAVQEFNSDSDSSQPRWMREAAADGQPRPMKERASEPGAPTTSPDKRTTGRRRSLEHQHAGRATDEAMMLESARPSPRKPPRPREDPREAASPRDSSPAMPSPLREQRASQPTFIRQQQASRPNPKSSLNRQAIEDQASQAYVSSARRKRPPMKPAESEPDLLENAAGVPATARPASMSPSRPLRSTVTAPTRPSQLSKPSKAKPVRPKASPRNNPPISSAALTSSHQHREKGTDHFKRGDYPAAHASYTTSLSQLPANHPITIILLTNRALTALKIGEPKIALADADNAISVIGPSRGDTETIDLQNGEATKNMRDFFGKALMRKAEALEQMERWNDAAAVWREAVESGHGGSTSIQGRNRCEKAAGINQTSSSTTSSRRPTPTPAKRPTPKPTPKPRSSALSDLSGASALSGEAVSRLRAANAAAEKADDEKFALSDAVDAKLTAWKGGKADNLRALLGSLDTVLWPGAGWKKVGMADLVLPGKVKIAYMKGIGKVHPDKIPTDATTEQRMIAGAVFSTLNEAWDKFKKENNL